MAPLSLNAKSNHLDIGGFAEALRDEIFRMADHLVTFHATNGEDVLPLCQGMGHEVMQAIYDQKVLFVTHLIPW
jgi:hypothetical protein